MIDDSSILVEQVEAVLDEYGDEAIIPLTKALCKEVHILKVCVGALIKEVRVMNDASRAKTIAYSHMVNGCLDMEKRIATLEKARDTVLH